MTLRRALTWSACLIFAGLAALWLFGTAMGRPHHTTVSPPRFPAQQVRLRSSDGIELVGNYWPGRRADGPAVLLLHGINSSRASFDRHARWLNNLGYAVLAIDFRGHGGSQAAPRTFGLYESRDALAAVQFLRSRYPDRKIGVVATSLGGAAALLGDEGPLPVQSMVLQAVYPDLRYAIANRVSTLAGSFAVPLIEPLLSYQSWLRYGVGPDRISPAKGLAHFRNAVLIIGGEADGSTTPADTMALYRAAAGPKSLWLLPGVGHSATGSIFSPAYRAKVLTLFHSTLGPP